MWEEKHKPGLRSQDTEWGQAGKSLGCQGKGVRTLQEGEERDWSCLGRGSMSFRKPALLKHGGRFGVGESPPEIAPRFFSLWWQKWGSW